MNSLVVLLSVVALASAKPSGLVGSVVTYSAPVVAAAPAAVSHQSRVDIKTTPEIIATAAIAPELRTVITEPLVAAPAAIAVPAAVSHQSRVDIKSSPAVVSTYAAVSPYIATPVLRTAFASAVYPSPAFVAPAVTGPVVPLDTPEVIAARAAHFEAKALAGAHLIRKRSAPLLATPVVSTYAAGPITYTAGIAPVARITPYAIHTPIITRAYGVHPW